MSQCKASMELINKNKKENIPPQSSAPNYMSAILPYTLARQCERDRGNYYKQRTGPTGCTVVYGEEEESDEDL